MGLSSGAPRAPVLWSTLDTVPIASVRPPVRRGIYVLHGRRRHARRPEDDQLDPVRARFHAPGDLRWYPHRVPLLHVHDFVVQLQPPAAPHHDVQLLLLLVAVAERLAEVGRVTLVADSRLLEPEVPAREPRLDIRRVPELRRLVLDVHQVDDRVARHSDVSIVP